MPIYKVVGYGRFEIGIGNRGIYKGGRIWYNRNNMKNTFTIKNKINIAERLLKCINDIFKNHFLIDNLETKYESKLLTITFRNNKYDVHVHIVEK